MKHCGQCGEVLTKKNQRYCRLCGARFSSMFESEAWMHFVVIAIPIIFFLAGCNTLYALVRFQ